MVSSLLPSAPAAATAPADLRGWLEPERYAPGPLRDSLQTLLDHPGSLRRWDLARRVAAQCGLGEAETGAAAAAVEFFHVASLVLDDLPCMDDARERRGQPCLHRRFGEATAILAALALINRAYALLARAVDPAGPEARAQARRLVDASLGPEGLVQGQALDLSGSGEPAAAPARTALRKTAALFRLALVLPALAGKAESGEVRQLGRLAIYWGLWYQALDDWADRLGPAAATGKTADRDAALGRPNTLLTAGAAATGRRIERLRALSRRALDRLTARHPGWAALEPTQAALAGLTLRYRHTAQAA